MNPMFDETRALALRLAGDARSGLQSGLRTAARSVGTAINTIDTQALRGGSRQVVTVARRNPLVTSAAVVTVVGAGVALWVLRRNRRRAFDERLSQDQDTIELTPSPGRGKARTGRKRVPASAT